MLQVSRDEYYKYINAWCEKMMKPPVVSWMRPLIPPSRRRPLLPGGGHGTKWRPALQGGLSFRSVAKIGLSVIVFFAIVNFLIIYIATSSSKRASLEIVAARHGGESANLGIAPQVHVNLVPLRHVFEVEGKGPAAPNNSQSAISHLRSESSQQQNAATSSLSPPSVGSGNPERLNFSSLMDRWQREQTKFRCDNQRLFKIHEFFHVGSDFRR